MEAASMPHAPRWPRRLLLATILPACWLGMMAVHELGHVLAAWLAGAEVHRVVLPLFSFSRTDVAHSDRLRAIIWAGPAVGVALPVLVWLAARAMKWEIAFVLRFFAGFCLIANGAYIGFGWIDSIGDAGDLRKAGESTVLMTIAGSIGIVAGLVMWSGLSAPLGLGARAKTVSPRVAMGVVAALLALIGVSLAVSGV
jgi:hypothetical protein